MRKLPAGEPCAGEPHARFGGRGRRKPFPTPIRPIIHLNSVFQWYNGRDSMLFPFWTVQRDKFYD